MHPESIFDLLTMAEVAKLLHCSKAHVCNAVAGKVRGCAPIPAVSLGRRKLVRRESLRQWIEKARSCYCPQPLRRSGPQKRLKRRLHAASFNRRGSETAWALARLLARKRREEEQGSRRSQRR